MLKMLINIKRNRNVVGHFKISINISVSSFNFNAPGGIVPATGNKNFNKYNFRLKEKQI
jgi:hypothetical protein